MGGPADSDYVPQVSDDHAATLRHWHERAYEGLRRRRPERVSYLGLDLVVPEQVFPPTPMSDLLGNAVLAEVRATDRVLDMGTGSGVNAILAASRAADVVGVDINPYAIEAATANAERNGVSARTAFLLSDVFDAVEGDFDLIVFDPPFRWFAPRDLLERSMADENYRTLTRFMAQAGDRLTPDGRILVFFGTTGDLDYLHHLIERNGFRRRTVASRELIRNDLAVTYSTYLLAR